MKLIIISIIKTNSGKTLSLDVDNLVKSEAEISLEGSQ